MPCSSTSRGTAPSATATPAPAVTGCTSPPTASASGPSTSRDRREVAGFDVVRHTELDAQEAWRRVTDWERHGQLVPLTTMRVDADPATDEVTLVARTAVGPVGFDDVMAVTFSR